VVPLSSANMRKRSAYTRGMGIPSLLRLEEHKALSRLTLSGKVLDLGGDKNSEYLRFFGGVFTTTTLNMSPETRPDILHDLEKPLPIESGSYDHVLLINVLEHIFEYRALLTEAMRVLKPGGSIVILVPFLFPVHPSPEDFHRFTASALQKELHAVGLEHASVRPLGGGVFAVRYLLLDRLLPKPLRLFNFYTVRYAAYALDALFMDFARIGGKKYDASDYALGYCAVASK
jgi:SAM-dependent methyltransferase